MNRPGEWYKTAEQETIFYYVEVPRSLVGLSDFKSGVGR